MKEYLHVDILQGTSNYSTRSNCSLTWYFLSWARNTGFLMHNTALCGRHCADAVDVAIVQSLSHVQLLATPLAEACQASLPFTISWSLPKFVSIELVMLTNHLILYCPLLLLTSILPCISLPLGFSNLIFSSLITISLLSCLPDQSCCEAIFWGSWCIQRVWCREMVYREWH